MPPSVLDSPVLDFQPAHSPELLFMVCNQCQPCRHAMRSDPKIVVSDHRALRFQLARIVPYASAALRVSNMKASVQFYRDVLGMELLYGGEEAGFSSLRAQDAQSAILNLEEGDTVTAWGRLIFYVADVDGFWAYLREKGFHPERPQDASRGERYFHMPDPDGHELSFARPLQ